MKSKKIYGLAGIAGLVAIGGTFAYYSAEQTFNNPFNTTNYSTSATEKFNPNGDNNDWKPGSTVDKEVFATNTGDGDVWVRVKFDEAWTRDGSLIPVFELTADATHQFGSIDGLDKFGVAGNGITASNSSSHQAGEDYKTDGVTANDTGSVVLKNFASNWDTNWAFNKDDGYFYYKTVLKKNESTQLLLDSVTLCSDTDMGAFVKPVYYIAFDEEPKTPPVFDVEAWKKAWKEAKKSSEDWIKMPFTQDGLGTWNVGIPATGSNAIKGKYVYTYKGDILDNENLGYANADYQLDITVEFLQTTEEDEIITTSKWAKDFLPKSSSTESTTPAPEETTQNGN